MRVYLRRGGSVICTINSLLIRTGVLILIHVKYTVINPHEDNLINVS